MKTFKAAEAVVALGTVMGLGISQAAELHPATDSAWQAYVRTTDARMQARLDANGRFLWTDESPGRDVRVRNGDILVAPGVGNGTLSAPNGLIHHWTAAAFIPSASLSAVLAVAHNYANYKQVYHPEIIDSELLGSTRGEHSYSMRTLHRVLFISAVLDSRFETRDFPVDANRWYIVGDATRVQEVENYGRPDEHLLPPGRGRGFIWRYHTITRYEERGGGVYVELEAVALSRDIPLSLRRMINPAIARFSQSELMNTLLQTRDAVMSTIRPERRGNGNSSLVTMSVPAVIALGR
jgi:hypothetical protein